MNRVVAALPLFALVSIAIAESGCATIAGGTGDQTVKIQSDPPGAAVKVDGVDFGATPAEVPLSRKTEHTVELAHAGYEPVKVKLSRNLNPWLFGNIICGGLIGLVVDVCTGATHKLSPNELTLTLKSLSQPVGTPSPAPANEPTIPAVQP